MACSNKTYYDVRTMTCYSPRNVTNVAALKKLTTYIEAQNLSLKQLNDTINNDPLPHVLCPEDAPMIYRGSCVACFNDTFYLLLDGACYVPNNFTNFKAIKASGKAYESTNHTLETV